MFTRIERWTDTTTGISHWRSISKENVTTLYGLDDNSCVADPDDPRKVFSYLISRTFDDKGNVAQYAYLGEDSHAVDAAPAHEANRTASSRGAQRYIKRILYGNFAPYYPDWSQNGAEAALPSQWHFQVVVDYGDHSPVAPAPAPDGHWTVRQDPFSQYRAGFEVRSYRRVRRVLMFHNFPDEPSCGADCLVRSTDFVYSDEVAPADPTNPIYTFLASVTQTSYKRKAGVSAPSSGPPLEFFYSQPTMQPDIFTLDDAESREGLPEGVDGSRYQYFDLNGEGLQGILRDFDGAWSYKRNLSPLNSVLVNGDRQSRAQFAAPLAVDTIPSPGHIGQGQQLLDLTGAGLTDLVSLNGPAPRL